MQFHDSLVIWVRDNGIRGICESFRILMWCLGLKGIPLEGISLYCFVL